MTLSVNQSMYIQPNDCMIGKNESERIRKMSVFVYFQLLSRNLPAVTEEKKSEFYLSKIIFILGEI